jgi:Na+-driven multidrug efflux pump
MSNSDENVRISRLLSFFLPLGISASLVTFSHVIINSTLARSQSPEMTIASFTIAMSVFTITERPAVLLRQTCSALVKDQTTFRMMSRIMLYLLFCILGFGAVISYTPVGTGLFRHVFNADQALTGLILDAYRLLIFVTVFSAIRCLYHGIIIRNLRTKWLTIGMAVRLSGMYLLSLYFLSSGHPITGATGALIFLFGMMIEAAVGFLEGRKIVGSLPLEGADQTVSSTRDIFRFFRPLMYSAFISVIIGPAINAMLGKTNHIELAIASYAIALSITHLVTSFFSYIHQIVLNFYNADPRAVQRFSLMLSLIPSVLLGLLSYTPLGPWFLQHVMGVSGALLTASLETLRIFMIMTLVFPWVDFCNGLLMLWKQTKLMVWSQAANVCFTVIVLFICVWNAPGWNGMIGALAQSLGFAAELGVLVLAVRYLGRDSAHFTRPAEQHRGLRG